MLYISRSVAGSFLMMMIAIALPACLAGQEGVELREEEEGEQTAPARRAGLAGMEVNAYIGMLNDEPEFRPNGDKDEFRRDAIFGVRFSYPMTDAFFIEGHGSNSLVRLDVTGSSRNVNSFFFGGALGYNFWPTTNVQGFVLAGAQAAHFRPDDLFSETDGSLHGGLGGRYFLTDGHAIRADARMHWVPDAIGSIERQLRSVGDLGTDALWALELSVGVSFFPGGG